MSATIQVSALWQESQLPLVKSKIVCNHLLGMSIYTTKKPFQLLVLSSEMRRKNKYKS
jgi:hypothetical protein